MSQYKSQVYFKNLDGLRAIAAFAVIFAHISYWFQYPDTEFFKMFRIVLSFNQAGGRLGVIFFFILSGFLITYLLYEEQSKNTKVNVIFFYIRRMLRIWPLYYITLIFGFVVYPLFVYLNGHHHHENASWFLYSIFAANFDHIYRYFPSSNILGVQWSVSVEEQFYLLWPLVFVNFNKNKYFIYILIGFILISDLFHYGISGRLNAADYHFISCVKYLSTGALLAYFCFHKPQLIQSILNKISRIKSLIIYVVCLLIMFFQYPITQRFPFYEHIFHFVPALFFVFVITEQNFAKKSLFKIGDVPFLTWLGKISYGLYLTHMIAINIVLWFFPDNSQYVLGLGLLSICLCILISYLSYQFIEKYFLSLKHKFSFLTVKS